MKVNKWNQIGANDLFPSHPMILTKRGEMHNETVEKWMIITASTRLRFIRCIYVHVYIIE